MICWMVEASKVSSRASSSKDRFSNTKEDNLKSRWTQSWPNHKLIEKLPMNRDNMSLKKSRRKESWSLGKTRISSSIGNRWWKMLAPYWSNTYLPQSCISLSRLREHLYSLRVTLRDSSGTSLPQVVTVAQCHFSSMRMTRLSSLLDHVLSRIYSNLWERYLTRCNSLPSVSLCH